MRITSMLAVLCFVLFGCGSRPSEAPRPSGGFSVHEWGLFAVQAGAPDLASAATEASGTLHANTANPRGTYGTGGLGTLGGKPVIYVHLDPGTNRVELDVALGVPRDKLVEQYPVGAQSGNAGWQHVVATVGACTSPTPPPTADSATCAGVRDHFCEAAEIGRYEGDEVSCLRVGDASSELLFYRAESLATSHLPLRLVRDGDAWKVTNPSNARIEGPVFFIETAALGQPVHIQRLEARDIGRPLTTPTEVGTTPADVRAALHAEAMRRGLSRGEADAFVDAWAPAYFDTCRRTGPEASGVPPVALAQVGRSLLYFAPAASVDAMLPLRTVPPARAQKRVFLVRWVDESSQLGIGIGIGNDPMSALGQLLGGEIGSNANGYIGHGSSCTTDCRVELEMPRVSRGLDANVVRRVVQRNINQVRHCYGQALAQTPDLHGRISIELTISPAGSVPLSAVAQSSLRNPDAERCIAGAVRRWAFPEPDPAGIVRATLQFKLTTETSRH